MDYPFPLMALHNEWTIPKMKQIYTNIGANKAI